MYLYRETAILRMEYALKDLDDQRSLPEKDRKYVYEIAELGR